MSQGELRLSCVLNQAGDFEGIAKTVGHLRRQTIAANLELVLVGTAERRGQVPAGALEGLGAWQFVEVARLDYSAIGFAEGARAGRAPLVVLCEDHCYPEPEWAAALVEAAARTGAAALAPAMENGNPDTLTSWANFLLCFPEWFRPAASGRITHGPGHNSCYTRAVIEHYRKDLVRWMNPERVLHLDLEARGLPVVQVAGARVEHVNLSRWNSYLAQSYLGGRVFGASRAHDWPGAKRMLYALASPLVPLVRLWRIYGILGTAEKRWAARFWLALPYIVCGLVCHAAGEAVGGLWREDDSAPLQYASYELYRSLHVVEGEEELLMDSAR